MMALLVLILVALMATCVLDKVHGFLSSNFPLDDCSAGEMDVLGLYADVNSKSESSIATQSKPYIGLVRYLLSLPNPNKTPRVQFAHVHDSVSSDRPDFNFSSWKFETAYSTQSKPYAVYAGMFKEQIYKNLVEALTLKVQLVERLFAEMGGVRKNVNHLAFIFILTKNLPYEESRNIANVLSQYKTDIKILLVIFAHSNEVVYLNDTLILSGYAMSANILTMAVCKQCEEGWFVFEHSDSVQYLSCYEVFDSFIELDFYDTYAFFSENCRLAGLETKEELDFVRNRMHVYFKESQFLRDSINSGYNFSAPVYIGLVRDKKSITRRFIWENDLIDNNLPITVNHWLPGKPTLSTTSICTVWLFNYYINVNDQEDSTSTSTGFVDGWKDISCYNEITSLRLCEDQLPRRIETKNKRYIQHAQNESLSRALSKGDFIMFRGNVVSVSANIGDSVFLLFLKNTYTNMFPMFDCGQDVKNFRYISYRFVCDNVSHCSNNRDEDVCQYTPIVEDLQCVSANCTGFYCCDGSCLEMSLINDGEIDCIICDYSTGKELTDESLILHKYLMKNITCALICNYRDCVTVSQLNDGHTDCTGKEGPLDETIGKLEAANTCRNILGHTVWAPKCVFVRDVYGGVIGCRDMSHLTNCSNFDCLEGYFKCANSYCIPQHYVFDQRADCPTGEDENVYLIGPCSGNFGCFNSTVCVHPTLVCNSHPDCPQGDDETDCRVRCPEGFRCLAGTITVGDYDRDVPLIELSHNIPESTRYIDWSGLNLQDTEFVQIDGTPDVLVIIWSNCQIRSSDYLSCPCLLNVQDLDMSYNLIQTLDGRDVSDGKLLKKARRLNFSYNRELVSVQYLSFRFLETLDLSHTAFTNLEKTFFTGLPKLKHLDLSYTFIVNFNKATIPSKLVLRSLIIKGMPVKDLSEDLFNSLTIEQDLYTDRFEFCCPQVRGPNIPSHTCHAPDDAISSCFDLIGADTQRVLIWVVASLAVLGNITVIVYRVIWDRPSLTQGFGLFVTNLGVSDFIMGVYLLIIVGADIYYRDDYVLLDSSWRASFPCQFAGFLATLSSETSILFVLLITLDRFLVMKFPFGQVRLSKMAKNIATIIIWIIGFLIALSPVVFGFDTFSSNAVCLGLPLTTKRMKGWEFSFAVFIALNLFLCLVIGYSQRAIFRAMSENRIKNNGDSNTSTRRPEDLIVAKQLSLVAIASFLCWFPVGFMGLMSVAKYDISNDVFAWTVAIVLPINSAANPILYTIPAVMDKLDKLKNGRKSGLRK